MVRARHSFGWKTCRISPGQLLAVVPLPLLSFHQAAVAIGLRWGSQDGAGVLLAASPSISTPRAPQHHHPRSPQPLVRGCWESCGPGAAVLAAGRLWQSPRGERHSTRGVPDAEPAWSARPCRAEGASIAAAKSSFCLYGNSQGWGSPPVSLHVPVCAGLPVTSRGWQETPGPGDAAVWAGGCGGSGVRVTWLLCW